MGSPGHGTLSSSSTTGVESRWRQACPSLLLPQNRIKVREAAVVGHSRHKVQRQTISLSIDVVQSRLYVKKGTMSDIYFPSFFFYSKVVF